MVIRFPGVADISVLCRNQTDLGFTLSHKQFIFLAVSGDRNVSTVDVRLVPRLGAQGDIQ